METLFKKKRTGQMFLLFSYSEEEVYLQLTTRLQQFQGTLSHTIILNVIMGSVSSAMTYKASTHTC